MIGNGETDRLVDPNNALNMEHEYMKLLKQKQKMLDSMRSMKFVHINQGKSLANLRYQQKNFLQNNKSFASLQAQSKSLKRLVTNAYDDHVV